MELSSILPGAGLPRSSCGCHRHSSFRGESSSGPGISPSYYTTQLREFIGLVNFYRLHPELCHHYPTSELLTQSGHPTFLHGLRMQQQLSLILNMLLLTPHSSSIPPLMHLQVVLRMLLMSRWGTVLQYSNGQWCPLSFSPGL